MLVTVVTSKNTVLYSYNVEVFCECFLVRNVKFVTVCEKTERLSAIKIQNRMEFTRNRVC